MSLLTKIETYLNITDNLAAGMSSFMAEKAYMEALQTTAKSLSTNDCCLMIIDEPYAKTLPAVGEMRVYNFVNGLKNIPQLMILIASHFEKPIQLEKESQGLIKNYHPELLELPDGNFKRTFKIIEGAATWWFTDTAKRERFVHWLSEVIGSVQ